MHWVLERIIVGRADRQTIAKYAVGPDRFLGVGLMLCAALLGLGVTQPLITSGGFMGLQGQYSLLALMAEFFKSGRGGLALSLAVLLVLLPVVLLSTAFDIWYKYELASDKFLRKSALLRHLARAILLVLALLIGALVFVGQQAAITLHLAAYYLVITLALQRLAAARLQPLLNAVQFVEEDKS
tara:strand:- start:577 stop:1128 length:552 start_codon:yes stop_codon:yes gene_type:complete